MSRKKLSPELIAQGWKPIAQAPRSLQNGPSPVTGFAQYLLAYDSFKDDGTIITGQGIYIPPKLIPTTKSVEEWNDTFHDRQRIGCVVQLEHKHGLHYVEGGWYVVYGSLIDHGGAGWTGQSWKPSFALVRPIAFLPLPTFTR